MSTPGTGSGTSGTPDPEGRRAAAPETVDNTPRRVEATPLGDGSEHTSVLDPSERSSGTAGVGHTRAVPVTHTKDADDDGLTDRRPRRDRTEPAYDAVPAVEDRRVLHQREREEFGGMKFGAAFFGWLSATGMFVLISTLLGVVAAVTGLLSPTNLSGTADQAAQDPAVAMIASAVVILITILISYFAGGYVAGRMARFDGMKQGIAVWLWALTMAGIMALIGLGVSNQAGSAAIPPGILGMPDLQAVGGDPLAMSVTAVLAGLLAALIGAILGGLTGMRYHRRIDRADFDVEDAAL